MTRAQTVRTHILLGLVAWCTGCVHAEFQWDHLGSLRLIEYDRDTEKAFYEAPDRDSFASELMLGGSEPILYADMGKSVYLGLRGGGFEPARSRRLRAGEWDFCDLSRRRLIDLSLGDPAARAGPGIYPVVLRLFLTAALFDVFFGSFDVERAIDAIDDASDWEREDWPLPRGEKRWAEMSRRAKEEALLWRLEVLAAMFAGGPEIQWAEHGGVHYGLVGRMVDEHDFFDDDYWPPSLLRILNGLDDGPRVALRGAIDGQRVLITQTFTCNYFEERRFRDADFFFHTGKHLLLGLHGSVWMLCSDGQWRKCEPYPLEPYPPARVKPAFFLRDKWLYVFGQSKTDPSKAVVLRTDLSKIAPR